MAGARVLVHDVDSLELFMETLQVKRDELEALYDILGSETTNQGENWQDPQYEHLKGLIQAYCSSCNSCFWIWMNLLSILVVLLQS